MVPNSVRPTSTKATEGFFRDLEATITKFSDGHVLLDNGTRLMSERENVTEREEKFEIDQNILTRFSPAGLEGPFKQLYSIIFPALYRNPVKDLSPIKHGKETPFQNFVSSSSAAILMGAKGSGKSLLLERVLAACREQLHRSGRRLYRMVEINGIVCRGEDVESVVYEMIRQLSSIAYRSFRETKKSPVKPANIPKNNPQRGLENEGGSSTVGIRDSGRDIKENRIVSNQTHDECDSYDDDDRAIPMKDEDDKNNRKRKRRQRRRKQHKIEKHMLRLRQATFNSNLALLESILKLAATDDVPILLNLDELDSFTDEGERQMLLYHFLDRVATPGSNLILVGMTSSFSALTLLEKRIRSRAEGTAKIIYLRPPPTYQSLLELLDNKLGKSALRKEILDRMSHPNDAEEVPNKVQSNLKSCTQSSSGKDNDGSTDTIIKVSKALEREFRFGKDIRWFSRVIATSLTLYRHDCIMAMPRIDVDTTERDSMNDFPLPFSSKYIWNALAMLGASVFENTTVSRQPDLCIVDDVAVSPRLQALLDLSTPQVALLLSARRILRREEHRDQAVLAPLTTERIIKEYESFRRGSISMGNSKLLKRAVYHLMQQGLLLPSIDHSGGGPLQYDLTKIYRNLDHYTLSRLPLHVPFDIDRELGKALEQNLLECPTALKEWGKSISKGS